MVKIIPFPTDEPIPDEVFQPRERYGLLVTGKEVPDFLRSEFKRWSPYNNKDLINLHRWEMLMTGTIDFGKRCPLNSIDDHVRIFEKDGIVRISRTKPEEFVHDFWQDELKGYERGRSRHGDYKEVVRIHAGTTEVLPEYNAAVERLSGLGAEDSLTTMVIFSHGENGVIQMGSSWLPYKKILEDLDRIKGKKAVFVYACNSGSFLKALRLHPKRRDYAAITSCEADNISTNWNDRDLDDFLQNHFGNGKKYSDLQLEPIREDSFGQPHQWLRDAPHTAYAPNDLGTHCQHPQMLKYFDVQLI